LRNGEYDPAGMTSPDSLPAKADLPELEAYEALAPIAQGGMAEVYLGRLRARPEHLVALKILRREYCRNAEFVAMFLDEARIASRLAHPNIATIFGLGHDPGRAGSGGHHFLAMELLRGRTLLDIVDTALQRGGRLPYEVVAWIGARIAEALHHAHELRDESGNLRQIVHRDVNPSNIMVTYRGEPKLIDFGLAKARDRITATAHGVLKGKLAYLAPEQVAGGTVDRRTDIFSLGVSLWEVSVGDRLFRADNDVETIKRVSKGVVPDPTTKVEGYPRYLADVLMKALSRSPNDRYRNAQELANALDECVRQGRRGVGPVQMGALVRVLFPESAIRPWEKVAAELGPPEKPTDALADGAIVRAWDEELQKMTWMSVAVEGDDAAVPAPEPSSPATIWRDSLEVALSERLAALDPRDEIARARVLLELAVLDDFAGDGRNARGHVEASLAARPHAAAYAILRRLRQPPRKTGTERTKKKDVQPLIELLDKELGLITEPKARADLLGERGRLLCAALELNDGRASFGRALELVPNHPGALKGLETVLRRTPSATDELAAHLARVAEAYVDEPTLAAWVYVERARLLDSGEAEPKASKATKENGAATPTRQDEARGSLARALELDASLGPVRRACVTHAAVFRDAPWLATLLTSEAELEKKQDRAAALELEAALLARHRLADTKRAVLILEQARKRRIKLPLLRRAILDELVVLHERAGRSDHALTARRERLTLLKDPGERAVELRSIARLEEGAKDLEHAIASIEEARRCAPTDPTLVDELDRLLERAGQSDRRIALFSHDAATSMDGERRASAALRAARIAEAANSTDRALELYRMVLASAPGDIEALDALDRLVRSTRDEKSAEEARTRIALHRHAAEHGGELERRIAHLEIVALLSEEMLGDAAVAASTYETILSLAPKRRSALVGLARAARRAGDHGRAAAALLAESEIVSQGAERIALRVRAAELLMASEPTRARALLDEVLARDAMHPDARAAKIRVHERSEQWHLVDGELAKAVDDATDDHDKIDRLLARAEVQRMRLGARREALATVREALAIDPLERRAIALAMTLLDELDDSLLAHDGLVAIAETVQDDEVKARALLRAAALAEYALSDDTGALSLLERAVELSADAAWASERRQRVAQRIAKGGDATSLARILEADVGRGDADAAFELALHRLEGSPERAMELMDKIATAFPGAAHALRLMEQIGVAADRAPVIANALSSQIEAFISKPARLGALWEEIGLVDWTLGGEVRRELELVLEVSPDDRAALDGVVEKSIAALRGGDEGARGPLALALRDLATTTSDDTTKLTALLALALTLNEGAHGKPGKKEALREFRAALRIDARSVLAAMGTAKLGADIDDGRAAVEGLTALADIASTPTKRAAHLTQAAGMLLAGETNLGPRNERLPRAAELLEKALTADPESVLSITLLVAVRGEENDRERLIATLSNVLDRAKSKEAIATAGTELARVARARAETKLLALDALRRVVATSPHEPAALKMLAEVSLEQGARTDAAKALESLVAHAREPRDRIEALFGLSAIYRDAGSIQDVERVLRVVVDVDPANTRALRELALLRREAGAGQDEISALLGRLADAAPPGEERGATLVELAEAKLASGDRQGAERDLVEAAAHGPSPARLARVIGFAGSDPTEQARLLSAVVARGEQLKKPHAAAWAMLGQIEIDSLRRPQEGVAHIKRALALEPAMPEAKVALARGLVALGQGEEATATVLSMMIPDPAPMLSLRDPGAALLALESSFARQGRRDESVVARELRAIGGALDDGSHVELRARRRGMVTAPAEAERIFATVVPDEAREAFVIVSALAGVEAKLARTDLEALGTSPRQRLTPASGHPAPYALAWLSRLLGIDCPPAVVSERLNVPRALCVDGEPWVGVPASLVSRPEPEQIASLVRPLVRIALAATWLDELLPDELFSLLIAIARRAAPGYSSMSSDVDHALVEDFSQKIGRAVGRKQKKALGDLAARLADAPPLTPVDAEVFARALGCAEVRAAFVITGDLLATVDALRAAQPALRRETDNAGPRALAAVLSHPLAGDLVRTAIAPRTTALRARLGTLWTGGSIMPSAVRTT
jgi:serine/threonine-protein kinase